MRLQPLPSRKDFQSKNQTPYRIALASCDLSLHGNISSPRIRFKLWPAAMAAMKTMKAMKGILPMLKLGQKITTWTKKMPELAKIFLSEGARAAYTMCMQWSNCCTLGMLCKQFHTPCLLCFMDGKNSCMSPLPIISYHMPSCNTFGLLCCSGLFDGLVTTLWNAPMCPIVIAHCLWMHMGMTQPF